MTTFVTVGNLNKPFHRLDNFINKYFNILPQPIHFQKGKFQYEKNNKIDYFDFCDREKFIEFIENSSVIITHAGVGNLLTILEHKRKPIVMPRIKKYSEHIDNHQIEIALKFSKMKLISLINENTSANDLKIYCNEINKIIDFPFNNNYFIKIKEFIDLL